jgi:hypothetical protein
MTELESYLEALFQKAQKALGSEFPVREVMLAILSAGAEEPVEEISTEREDASGQ